MPKLSTEETATRFGVSRQRVLQWIASGRLAATWEHGTTGRFNGRYLISDRARRPKPIRPGCRKAQ